MNNEKYPMFGERYEDMIDYRSYTHNLSSCEIKAWKKFMPLGGWKRRDNPIIPDKWETRQGMKCTHAPRKLLSPKSRLRLGIWNVRTEQGRPKQSWRRTVIKELDRIRKTWGEAEKIAINRVRWKVMVETLCLMRGKED